MSNSKYKSEYLLICDYAFFSGRNKANIIGVFTQIYAEDIPTIYPRFFIVGKINHGEEKLEGVSIVLSYEDKELEAFEIKFKDKEGNAVKSSTYLLEILGYKFENYGEYSLTLLVKGEEIATTKLNVLEPIDEE